MKALEIGVPVVLSTHHIDIVVYILCYKWFGKPSKGIKGKKGEGEVGFW